MIGSFPDSDTEHQGLVCYVLDAAGQLEWANPAALKLAPWPPPRVETLEDLVHPEDRQLVGDLLAAVRARGRAVGMVRICDVDSGSVKHFQVVLAPAPQDGPAGFPAVPWPGDGRILAQAWDVTPLVTQRQRLEAYAFRDPLTGVANRRTFMTVLDQHLHPSRRSRPPVAVMFADVDGFKRINDQYGHQAGDQVLVELAARLAARLRPEDTLARIGGDEFAVICPDLSGWSAASVILDRLRAAASAPVAIEGNQVSISVSIGLAFAEESSERAGAAAHLLALADARMFRAKFAARDPEQAR